MLETIEQINSAVNGFIWGVPAMICIIGVGLYLSFRTGFIQICRFPYAIRTTIGRMFRKRSAADGAMTPFQAVCTALAATVGTGNIAGVAGAICTLTALVILCSGIQVNYGEAAGAELTILGFTSTYGGWVSVFTAVAMCCFAFSTIIGWGLYGARCIEFLFSSNKVIKPFMLAYSLVAILGATVDLGLIWNIADTFNGLTAIPNLIALFLLSGTVVRLAKEFFENELD